MIQHILKEKCDKLYLQMCYKKLALFLINIDNSVLQLRNFKMLDNLVFLSVTIGERASEVSETLIGVYKFELVDMWVYMYHLCVPL